MSTDGSQSILERMSLADKIRLCSGADFWTTIRFDEYGIPSVRMADGPHGLRRTSESADLPGSGVMPATCFPPAVTSACSWDRELLRAMGEAIAAEARAAGVQIVLGPGVNIKRNPLCGRNFEYFSEDPHLAGELAAAWIEGLQEHGVGASLKHFAANNQESWRMTADSIVDERALRELYLAAFQIVVKKAPPATVMCAYNKLNGTYCNQQSWLLRTILRDEWGYDGVLVSDWGAVHDRTASFEAGLDLEMPGGSRFFDQAVLDAVRSGSLEEARVDESCSRLLRLTRDYLYGSTGTFDPDQHHRLARRIAAASAVLLKNEGGLLPLREGQSLALIGAMAAEPRIQGAGSSFVVPMRVESPLEGFEGLVQTVTYFPGYSLTGEEDGYLADEAVVGAERHDIAVVFAGLPAAAEGEGYDRKHMRLPAAQDALIERVAAANPRTVVVLLAGAPVEMPWLDKVQALIYLGLPGQAGGSAVGEVLAGVANPGGKLAESWPVTYADVPSAGFFGERQAEYRESIYVGYRYFDAARKSVAFPFGHGLSYTEFEYRDLQLSSLSFDARREGSQLVVTARVRNTGKRPGAEVVQLYVGQLDAKIFRPEKELKGFEKVYLEPGDEAQVAFHLRFRDFAIYHPRAGNWAAPEGRYRILVGSSSQDIRLQAEILVNGDHAAASGAPDWYRTLRGAPTREDFERLLGRRLKPAPVQRKGHYTLESSLQEMQTSLAIRLFEAYLKRRIARDAGGADPLDPNYLGTLANITENPLRNLVVNSGGDFPAHVARGLVELANGRWGRAIAHLLGKQPEIQDRDRQEPPWV